jgi:hypothetical protein
MKTTNLKFDICPELHAMSDMGFANSATTENRIYSRSHTNNAECYAKECHRRGRCLSARQFVEQSK